MGESKIQTVRSHAMENVNRRGILMWMLTLVLAAAMSIGFASTARADIVGETPMNLDLTWKITDDGELIIQPKLNADGQTRYKGRVAIGNNYDSAAAWPWHGYRNQITKVTMNTMTSEGMPRIETYNGARLRFMFADMPNLKEADVSGLLTTRVNDVRGMFQNCSSLEELDLSTWINNGSMQYMQDFVNGCSSLKKFTLNNPDFHTKVVNTATNASDYQTYTLYEGINAGEKTYNVGLGDSGAQTQRMFDGCTSLEELDMSGVTISTWKGPQGGDDNQNTFIRSIRNIPNLRVVKMNDVKLPGLKAGVLGGEFVFHKDTLEELYFGGDIDIDDSINDGTHDAKYRSGLEEIVDKLIEGCYALQVADLSNWDTSSMKDLGPNTNFTDESGKPLYTVFDFKDLIENGAFKKLIAEGSDTRIWMHYLDPERTDDSTISPYDISEALSQAALEDLHIDWVFDFGDRDPIDLEANPDDANTLHSVIDSEKGYGNLAPGTYIHDDSVTPRNPFEDDEGNSTIPKTYYVVDSLSNVELYYSDDGGETYRSIETLPKHYEGAYDTLYYEVGDYHIQDYDGAYRVLTKNISVNDWNNRTENNEVKLDDNVKLKLVYSQAAVDVNGKRHDVVVDINSVTFKDMDLIPSLSDSYTLDPYDVNPWQDNSQYTDDEGITHTFDRSDQYKLVGSRQTGTDTYTYDPSLTYTRQLMSTMNGGLTFWNQIYDTTAINDEYDTRQPLLSKGSGTYIDYDITVDDALPDTSVLFWLGDLDVAHAQEWHMDDEDYLKDYMTSDEYGPGSEGVVLGSGNDLDTLTFARNTGLERYDSASGSLDPASGNYIVGTGTDPNTSWSRFYLRAAATGANYTWTSGISCKTDILGYAQVTHDPLPPVYVIPEARKTVNGATPAGEYAKAFSFTLEKASEIRTVPYTYYYADEDHAEDRQDQYETVNLPNSVPNGFTETHSNDEGVVPFSALEYKAPGSSDWEQHDYNEHNAEAYVYRITEMIPADADKEVLEYNKEKVIYYLEVIISDPKTDLEMYKGTRADVRIGEYHYTGETPTYPTSRDQITWGPVKTTWSQDATWLDARTPIGAMTGSTEYPCTDSSRRGLTLYKDAYGTVYYVYKGTPYRYVNGGYSDPVYEPRGKMTADGRKVFVDASGKPFFRDDGKFKGYPNGEDLTVAGMEQVDRKVEYDPEEYTVYVDKNGVRYIKVPDGDNVRYLDPDTFDELGEVDDNTVFPSDEDQPAAEEQTVEVEGQPYPVKKDVHGKAYAKAGDAYYAVNEDGTLGAELDVEDSDFNPNEAEDQIVYTEKTAVKDGREYPVKVDALGKEYIAVPDGSETKYYDPQNTSRELTAATGGSVAPASADKAEQVDKADGQKFVVNGHTIYEDSNGVKYYSVDDASGATRYYSPLGTLLAEGTDVDPASGDQPVTSNYDIRQDNDGNLFYKGEGTYNTNGTYTTIYYNITKNPDGSYSADGSEYVMPGNILDTTEAMVAGTFENTAKVSEIEVKKETEAGKAGEFTYEISFDSDFEPTDVVFDPVTPLTEGEGDNAQRIQFVETGKNTYRFTLIENQKVTIKNVPFQTTYTLKEVPEANGWELVSIDGDTTAADVSHKVTVERYKTDGSENPDWNYRHTFKNRFTELVLNKVRIGGFKDDEFEFTAKAKLSDLRPEYEYSYGVMDEDHTFTYYAVETDLHGNATIDLTPFMLKGNHNENEGDDDIVLVFPKNAKVAIEETPIEGVATTWQLDKGEIKPVSAKGATEELVLDKDKHHVTFYNTKLLGTAGIDLTKFLDGRDYIDSDQFTFMLTAEDGTPMPVSYNTETGEFDPAPVTADAPISESVNKVRTGARFATLKYTLADLEPVEVVYSEATEAQKHAVVTWSEYEADGTTPKDTATGTVFEKTFTYTIEENPLNGAAGDTAPVTNDSRRPQVKLYVLCDPNATNAAGDQVGAIYISAAEKDGEFVTNGQKADATLNYNSDEDDWFDNEGVKFGFKPKVVAEPVYFTNEYTSEASWTPEATKVLKGRPLERDQFDFKLDSVAQQPELGEDDPEGIWVIAQPPTLGDAYEPAVDNTLQDVDLAADGAPAKGTNDLVGPVSFEDIEFTNELLQRKVKYRVADPVELRDKVISWELDGTVYGPIPDNATAEVTVDGKTETVNYAEATDAQRKAAEGTTADSKWRFDGKTYIATTVDPEQPSRYFYRDAEGNLTEVPEEAQGIYYAETREMLYKMWEVPGSQSGYTYDEHNSLENGYEIRVTLTEQNDGTMLLELDNNKDDLIFTNTYEAEGEATIQGLKVMAGDREQVAGEFTFTIESDDPNAPLPEGGTLTNAADGTIDFGTLRFTHEHLKAAPGEDPGAYDAQRTVDGFYRKTFVYDLKETGGSNPGMTYDGATIKLAITVQEDNAGNIKVVAVNGVPQDGGDVVLGEAPHDKLVFTNEYHASGEVEITATKELVGKTLADGMFFFELSNPSNADHPVVDEKPNAANGSVAFDKIVYNLAQLKADAEAGICEHVAATEEAPEKWVYTYKVKELVPADGAKADGIIYDTSEKTITVTVTDNGDGTLDAVVDGEAAFTNKSETIEIEVKKTWDDDELQALEGSGYDRPKSVSIKLAGDGDDTRPNVALSDDNGWTYTFTDLPAKTVAGEAITYTVTEVDAPYGYTVTYKVNGGDAGDTATIDSIADVTEEKASVEVINTPNAGDLLEADLVLHKIDSVTEKNIGGVKFEVYDADGALVTEVTTDIHGVAHINFDASFAPEDTQDSYEFTLKEAEPAPGYEANETEYKIVVKDGEVQRVELKHGPGNIFEMIYDLVMGADTEGWDAANRILTVKNTPKKNNITITKTFADDEGKPLPAEVLSGFTIMVDYMEVDDEGTGTQTPKVLRIESAASETEGTYTWTVENVAYDTDVHVHERNYVDITGYDYVNTGISYEIEGRVETHGDDVNFTMPDGEAKVEFTNNYKMWRGDIDIAKVWNDDHNRDGKRPGTITFTVTADHNPGGEGWTQQGDSWTRTVSFGGKPDDVIWYSPDDPTIAGLPIYGLDGKLITYTITEEVPDEYTGSPEKVEVVIDEDGYVYEVDFFNAYKPKTGSVTVNKVWDDEDNKAGMRRETTVYLYADGLLVGEVTEGLVTTTDGEVKKWSDLPVYTADGTDGDVKIVYSVAEAAIPGYTPSYDREDVELTEGESATIEITNSYEPEYRGLTVTKRWEDDNNADGFRPDSIKIDVKAVYADGSGAANVFEDGTTDTLTITLEPDSWSYSFGDTDLPKEHDGKLVTYTVDGDSEVFIGGDPLQYLHTCVERTAADQITVTNVHEVVDGCVEVKKVWDDNDNQDGLRTDVTVSLYAGDELVGEKTISGNSNTPAEAVWHELPVYKNGEEIVYKVVETPIEGYETSYSDPDGRTIDPITGVGEMTVTNTHEPATVQVTVTKAWAGEEAVGDKYRVDPEIRLFGTVGGKAVYEADTQTIDKSATGEDAKAVWTDLPKFHEGSELVWQAVELAIPGYTPTIGDPVVDAETGDATIAVTNTFKPLTSVSVVKEWDDGDNRDNSRGDVTYTLTAEPASALADGYEVAKTVGEADDWAASWTNLPATVVEGGEEVAVLYTVAETAMPDGYSSRMEATGTPGVFKAVNTREIDTTTVEVAKEWSDSDNAAGIRPDHITVELLADNAPAKHADGSAVKPLIITDESWTGTFENLPVRDADGNEIAYTVVEDEIPNYASEISGTAADGYTITNTYEPAKIQVKKVWDDGSNKDGTRKATTARLYVGDKTAGVQDGAVGIANDSFEVITWEVPAYDAKGNPITYTVVEDSVPTYTTSYATAYDKAAGGSYAADDGVVAAADVAPGATATVTVTNKHVLSVTLTTPEVKKILEGRDWFDEDKFAIALIPSDYGTTPMPIDPETGSHRRHDDVVIVKNTPDHKDRFADIEITLEDMVDPETLEPVTSRTFTYHVRELTTGESGLPRAAGVTYSLERYEVDVPVEVVNGALVIRTDQIKYYKVVVDHSGDTPVETKTEVTEITFTNTYSPDETVYHMSADKELTSYGENKPLNDGDFSFVLKSIGDYAAFAPMPKDTVGEGAERSYTTTNVGNAVRFENNSDPTDGLRFAYDELVKPIDEGGMGFTDEQLREGIEFEYQMYEKIPDDANIHQRDDGYFVQPIFEGGEVVDEILYDPILHNRSIFVQLRDVEGSPVLHVEGKADEHAEEGYQGDNHPETLTPEVWAQHHNPGGAPLFANYHIPVENIPVEKVWEDNDDADQSRPDSVTVELERYPAINPDDGTLVDEWGPAMDTSVNPIDPMTLDESTEWKGTFERLPEYVRATGEHIQYRVIENPVPDGYTAVIEKTEVGGKDSFTVTNYRNIELPVVKIWNDSSNLDGKRPASVVFQLEQRAEGEQEWTEVEGKTIELTATGADPDDANKWNGKFEDLPKYTAEGKGISYRVSEVRSEELILAGYKDSGKGTAQNNYTITNAHVTDTLSVAKIWDDAQNAEGLRPMDDESKSKVIVHLYKLSDETLEQVEVAKLEVEEGTPVEWTGLPVYEADGTTKITYVVEEEFVAGYTTTYTTKANPRDTDYTATDNQVQLDGLVGADHPAQQVKVKNSLTPAVSTVKVAKSWLDESNRDGKRPAGATFELYKYVWDAETKSYPAEPVKVTTRPATQADVDARIAAKLGDNVTVTDMVLYGAATSPATTIWNETAPTDANNWNGEWVNLPLTENGKTVVYTVKEVVTGDAYGAPGTEGKYSNDPYVSGDQFKGFTVKNVYTSETVDIDVTKTWAGDIAAFRPDHVIVALKGDGTATGDRITLTAEEEWTGSFDDLPKYKVGEVGQEIDYTLVELAVPGYTATVEGSVADGFTIANTPDLGALTVEKTWDDNNDNDSMRPTLEQYAAMLKVLGNGEVVSGLTPASSSKDGNTYVYTYNVPTFDAKGAKVTYTVEEDGIAGYSLTEGPTRTKLNKNAETNRYEGTVTLTNQHVPGTVTFAISKVWEDNHNADGKRPAPSAFLGYFKLYKQVEGTEGTSEVTGVTPAITAVSDTAYTVSWSNLASHTADGKAITYVHATETLPEGSYYQAEVGDVVTPAGTETGAIEAEGTVTNKQVFTDITATKVWVDQVNDLADDELYAGTRPAQITVKLMDDETVVKSETVDSSTADARQEISFVKVPVYGADGTTKISYTVAEDAVPNYTTTYIQPTKTVVNTYKMGNISGTKQWVDGDQPHDTSEELKGKLTVNYSYIDGEGAEQTGTVSNPHIDWSGNTYTVVGLPEKTADGYAYTYWVTETAPTGYTVSYSGDDAEKAFDGETIINTLETVDVSATKVWADGDNQDGLRTDVTLHLTGTVEGMGTDAKSYDDRVIPANATGDDLTVTWTGLPAYYGGQKVTYSVTEDPIEGYTPEVTGSVEDGFTVTNTHVPETFLVTLGKLWDDNGDEEGARTATTAALYKKVGDADEELVEEYEIGTDEMEIILADKTELPAYEGGQKITYRFVEVPVEGYKATYSATLGESSDGPEFSFTVDNTVTDAEGKKYFIGVMINSYGNTSSTPTGGEDDPAGDNIITLNKSYKDKDDAVISGKGDVFSFTLTGMPAGTEGSTVSAEGKSASASCVDNATVIEIAPAITFAKLGIYAFELAETEGTVPGVTYDDTVYTLLAAVTDENSDGTWEVAWSIAGSQDTVVTFNNSYDDLAIEEEVALTKELTGRDLVAGEFSFVLFGGPEDIEADGLDANVKLTAANAAGTMNTETKKATGAVTFADKLSFSLEDLRKLDGSYADSREYKFVAYETVGDDPISGVIYDSDPKELTATLTYMAASGDTPEHLDLAWTPALDTVKFENTYDPNAIIDSPTAEGEGHISVAKRIDDSANASTRTAKADEFTFALENTGKPDGSEIINTAILGVNDANGKVSFPNIRFDKAGTYTFTMKELAGNDATIETYDSTEYTVIATVGDEGDGTMTVTWQIQGDADNSVEFVNVAETELTDVTMRKVWVDSVLHDADSALVSLIGIPERPESVVFRITATVAGDEGDEPANVFGTGDEATNVKDVTLEGEGDSWVATEAGLPKYYNGKKVTYTVTEPATPGNYTQTTLPMNTIVNKFNVTEISGEKVWAGDAPGTVHDNASEVALVLHWGIMEGDTPALVEKGSVEGIGVIWQDSGEYTIPLLPVADANGNELIYWVTETPIELYKTAYYNGEGEPTDRAFDEGKITNTYVGTPSSPTDGGTGTTSTISVSKAIVDQNNRGRKPAEGEFEFKMTLDSAPEGAIVAPTELIAANAAAGADGTAEVHFGNFNFERAGEYKFTLVELAGDDPTIAGYDGTRLEVIATVTPDDEGTLSVAWTITGDEDGAVTFNNTTVRETKEFFARANWTGDDYDAPGSTIERRPSEVTVKLQKMVGSEQVDVVDSAGQPITVKLKPGNNWADKFPGAFPVYDESGNEIVYKIVETTAPAGYDVTYVQPSASRIGNGGVVNYAYNVESITGTKTWIDGGLTHDNGSEIKIVVTAVKGDETKTLVEGTDYHVDWDGNDYTVRGLASDGSTYTVAEQLDEPIAAKYDTAQDGNDFTNTIKQELITLTVTKKWVGANTEDVAVKLKADGADASLPVILSVGAGSEASYTWTDLPKYALGGTGAAGDGHEIAYTVEEIQNTASSNWNSSISYDADGNAIITNTFDETTIPVVKIWDDGNDQDGIRPESVTVTLMVGDEVAVDLYGNAVAPLELSSANGWSGAFYDVPRTDNAGAVIAYSLVESEVAGYEEPVIVHNEDRSFTVTNSHTPATTSMKATKVWLDTDGETADPHVTLHTDVVLHLFGLDENGLAVYDGGTKVIANGSDEPVEWVDLPVYHYSNVPLAWMVLEEAVPGYVAGYEWDNDTCTVKNVYAGALATIKVDKEWDDGFNVDGKRPTSVFYQLYRTYENAEGAVFDELVESLPDGASAIGKDEETLAYVDGKVEVEVGERTTDAATDGKAPVEFRGLPVTMTIETGETTESSRVEYKDVTVYVNAAGEQISADEYEALPAGEKDAYEAAIVQEPQTITENAPVTKEVAVLYSVREAYADTALKTAGYNEPIIAAAAPGEFVAINSRDRDMRDLTVTKVWSDGDHADDGMRPDHITFDLTGDGATPIHGAAVELTDLVVAGDTGWQTTIHNLPVNSDGEQAVAIEYAVSETNVALGYTPSYSSTDAGVTITNTYNGFTSLKATKVWAGDELDTSTRKDVVLHLIQVEPESGTRTDMGMNKTIPAAATGDDLTVEWTDLVSYVGGKAVTYTVEEEAISGYTTSYSNGVLTDEGIEVVVTNTAKKITITYYDPLAPEGEREVVKEVIDRGGDEPPAPADPEHDGEIFRGWKREVDEDGNVTYVAQYDDIEKVTITYTDPETGFERTDTIDKGANEPEPPADPEREGYAFGGWEREQDKDGNVIYRAKWIKNPEPGEIKVTYQTTDPETGEVKTIIADVISRGEDEPGSPADPTREGYIFGGWRRTMDENGNVTYDAQWIKDVASAKPTVTYFDPMAEDGKMILGAKQFDSQTDADDEAKNQTGRPSDPAHEGLVFVGWVVNQDEFGNYIITAKYNQVAPSGGKTVSYIDPLAPDGKRVIKSVVTDDPSSVTAPDLPTHDGYRITGWVVSEDSAGNLVYTPIIEKICPACPTCPDCKNVTPTPAGGGSSTTPGRIPDTGDPASLAWAGFALVGGVAVAVSRRRRRS